MNCIITSIDENPHYWDTLKVFLYSLGKNNGMEKVIVNLIDCHSKKKEQVEKLYPAEVYNINTLGSTPNQRNYLRHQFIQSALKTYKRVAWIDNDTIIRGDISGIWDNVENSTMKILQRSVKKDNYKWQTGVYVMGSSALTIEYLEAIIKELKGKDDWILPQELMYRLHEKFYISLKYLREKYNDSTFKDDSLIWHCKQSHFYDPKFQKEFQKHLEGADKCLRS